MVDVYSYVKSLRLGLIKTAIKSVSSVYCQHAIIICSSWRLKFLKDDHRFWSPPLPIIVLQNAAPVGSQWMGVECACAIQLTEVDRVTDGRDGALIDAGDGAASGDVSDRVIDESTSRYTLPVHI